MNSSLLNIPLPKIEEAGLLLFPLQLKSPFETSFGSVDHREGLVCYIKAQGLEGFGECVADEDPLYSYETVFTAWQVLEKYLLPTIRTSTTLGQYLQSASSYRGHTMAKEALKAACWDIFLRR